MQRIYEPENLMEGELLQQMLASEGIEAHLVGAICSAARASCRYSACWGWRSTMTRPPAPAS